MDIESSIASVSRAAFCREVEIVMEERNGGSVLVNGAPKKVQRGSWTKDQKRQIVSESQVAGASLAEVACNGTVFGWH
jgi:hypothetical protein